MLLKIKRISSFSDKLRADKVIVDGKEIGKIKDGEEIEFSLTNSPFSAIS